MNLKNPSYFHGAILLQIKSKIGCNETGGK